MKLLQKKFSSSDKSLFSNIVWIPACAGMTSRITSYNVCYTKLLRVGIRALENLDARGEKPEPFRVVLDGPADLTRPWAIGSGPLEPIPTRNNFV